MGMAEFARRYEGTVVRPASEIAARWERQEELDRLLATPVAGGMTLGDMMVGDGLRDQISPELLEAFHQLMGGKAQSYDQVRQILLDRLEDGPASVLGMISKVKGQVGENWFVEQAQALGVDARLADSASQEAWDVAVEADGAMRYVQVKMYQDAAGIVEHVRDVQAKLQTPGHITDGTRPVESIEFAIPADMVAPVRERLEQLGLEADLIAMQGSAQDAGDVVQAGFDHVGTESLSHLFAQLLGAGVAAAALHGLAQSFLIYKGAKDGDTFLEDTLSSTGLTVGGLAAGIGVEAALSKLAWIGGVPTYVLVLSTSITTRCVLRRVLSRKGYVQWLAEQNEGMRERVNGRLVAQCTTTGR